MQSSRAATNNKDIMEQTSGSRQFRLTRYLLVPLLLAGITGFLFLPVGEYGFVNYDDPYYVYENERVLNGLNADNLRWAATTGYFSNWHPLTWISLMADAEFHGDSPGGYHLSSLALHVLNTLLLYLVLLGMTGAAWSSAVVALLFGIHPLHVEAVAWVSSRKDVLSSFFWFLTLFLYLRFVRVPSLPKYGFVCLSFFTSLTAKAMPLTLPLMLLLLDYWPLRRAGDDSGVTTLPLFSRGGSAAATLVREKIPLFLLAAASAILTFAVQRGSGSIVSFERIPLTQRLQNVFLAYAGYLKKTFWPADLSAFYPFAEEWSTHLTLKSAVAALLIILLSAGAILLRKRFPELFTGWFWYLTTLIPVIGFVQLSYQAMADRYTYVPLVGIFIALVWPLCESDWARRHRGATLAAASAVFLLLAFGSRTRLPAWRDSISLYRSALSRNPENYMAHHNLGFALAGEGKSDEAILHYREAIRIQPRYAKALNSLGVSLIRQEHYEEAVHHLLEAVRAQPDLSWAHSNLGIVYERLGRHGEAA